MEFKNKFLARYLDAVEKTESPRIFHLWAALSGVSASLGRRCWFELGPGVTVFPNMYVALVGNPAVKKSSAINAISGLLRQYTHVRFAPKDTAGQRQGLVAAMHVDADNEIKHLYDMLDNENATVSIDDEQLNGSEIDLRDKHSMLAAASELTQFIGSNNVDMLTFLITVWDGEDYDYTLRRDKIVIKDPLLGILGGTTPAAISQSFPPTAFGQGFMSRIIFVYAAEKYKQVARPSINFGDEIGYTLQFIYNNFEGAFTETPEAAEYIDYLYTQPCEMNDPRFVHYIERRQPHMIKLAMALAASRCDKEIQYNDVHDAYTILTLTEKTMPDALGEFGMSPIAAAKQKMIEFVNSSPGPVILEQLWIMMHRDMKKPDFDVAVADMVNAQKLRYIDTNHGRAVTKKKTDKIKVDDELLSLLSGGLPNAQRKKA